MRSFPVFLGMPSSQAQAVLHPPTEDDGFVAKNGARHEDQVQSIHNPTEWLSQEDGSRNL